MGDFNVDLLRIDSHPGSENFINTLGSFFFQPHILQPTRVTDHSSTLIDNIFFNSIEHFIISGNLVYDLTDHLPNFIILNKFSSLPYSVKVYKRGYFKFNQASLISEIQNCWLANSFYIWYRPILYVWLLLFKNISNSK